MRSLSLMLLLVWTGIAAGQEELRVLPAAPETQKMLYTYLLKEAKQHFEARRLAVSRLKTPTEIRERQADLKAKFLAALGGFPDRTPLRAQVVGKLEGPGFRVEKVIYESRPHHHVTAVLYLPQSKEPVPGVLVPCGHSTNGKAAEAYQRACILMAQNGLAVLCYDPIGQGERVQLLTKEGKPAIAGSTSEHTMVGIGALLVGRSTATYRIWDGIRSLDYLAGRPEVDATRLGCTGNSGGGTLTAYLMALDERIVAAAPSCYITSLERLFETIGPQDAEQNITGQVAFGMEHADYVTMRAPRPTLICTGTRDFFDIKGAWTSFREAKLLYGKLGHGERVDLFEYDDKHGFSKPRREAAMRWMRRWLLHKDDAPFEGSFPVFSDAQLQCTRSGQVLEDFRGRSAFDMNAEAARDLAAKRVKTKWTREQASRVIEGLLGGKQKQGSVVTSPGGILERDGYKVEKRIYETEPGIHVPALEFVPGKPAKEPLILYLHGRGMAEAAGPGGPIEKLVQQGRTVLTVDLRGLGETSPGKPPKGRPDYFGSDAREAFLAMHLNRPLLAQRIADIRAVLRARLGKGSEKADVIGVEAAGPIALHAALFEPRIGRIILERSLASWSMVAQNPISHNQLANVVPGALKAYDLPELAGVLAPLPLTIREPVDGVKAAIGQKELDRIYACCRDSYAAKGATTMLVLQARSSE
jgi:cephalosporin-C deacetylase-like acetyl esterase